MLRIAKRDIPVPFRSATGFLCPGSPRSGAMASALMRLRHGPYDEWLDGSSEALAYGLRGCGNLRPLRHCGHTPAPAPTGDVSASCIALPWRAVLAAYGHFLPWQGLPPPEASVTVTSTHTVQADAPTLFTARTL